jgi:hypothetical protein
MARAGDNEDYVCHVCHGHGWIPFWTEPERAGLKAMGRRVYSIAKAGLDLTEVGQDLNTESIAMIRAYVRAAREKKEPSCEKS